MAKSTILESKSTQSYQSPTQKKLTKEQKQIQKAQAHMAMAPIGSPEYKKAKSFLDRLGLGLGLSSKSTEESEKPKARPAKVEDPRKPKARPSTRPSSRQSKIQPFVEDSTRALKTSVKQPAVKQPKRDSKLQKTAIRHPLPAEDDDDSISENRPGSGMKKRKIVAAARPSFVEDNVEDVDFELDTEHLQRKVAAKPSGLEPQPKVAVKPCSFEPQFETSGADEEPFFTPKATMAEQETVTIHGTPQKTMVVTGTPTKTIICSPDTKVVFVAGEQSAQKVNSPPPKSVGFDLGTQPGEGLRRTTKFRRMSTPYPTKEKKATMTPETEPAIRTPLFQQARSPERLAEPPMEGSSEMPMDSSLETMSRGCANLFAINDKGKVEVKDEMVFGYVPMAVGVLLVALIASLGGNLLLMAMARK